MRLLVQLPMKTTIPLNVLDARIDETLSTDGTTLRLWNRLQSAGITRNWQLLVQSEASLMKIKNFGRKCLNEIKKALADKGWRLGTFLPQYDPLAEVFSIYPHGMLETFSAVNAVGPCGANFVAEFPKAAEFLAKHGLHANMTVDELFVDVPTERPPLTEAQIAFLYRTPAAVFTGEGELTWCHTFYNTKRSRCVFDIALILPHLRQDDVHKDVIARIRKRIEAEVGPLPLALTSDELHNFFR